MKPKTLLIISLIALIGSSVLLAAESSSPPSSDRLLYLEAKKFLDWYGNATDFDDQFIRDQADLLSNGKLIITPLISLFNESTDDEYRSRAISLLRQVEGPKTEAIALIEFELSKPSSEWIGRRWLSMASILLREVDLSKARHAYVRIIDADDDRDSLSMAATMLKKVGRPEDIPALERLIQRRKQITLPEGQTVDGVTYGANEAIKAIRSRSEADELKISNRSAGKETKRENILPTDIGEKTAPPQATDESQSSITWWMGGGAILISLLWILLRRTK